MLQHKAVFTADLLPTYILPTCTQTNMKYFKRQRIQFKVTKQASEPESDMVEMLALSDQKFLKNND